MSGLELLLVSGVLLVIGLAICFRSPRRRGWAIGLASAATLGIVAAILEMVAAKEERRNRELGRLRHGLKDGREAATTDAKQTEKAIDQSVAKEDEIHNEAKQEQASNGEAGRVRVKG